MTKVNRPLGKQPCFGPLSIIAPLAGILWAWIYAHSPGDSTGWGMTGAARLFLILAGSFLFGLISALVGMFRQERLTILSVIGLILNAVPVFYALYELN